MLTYRFVPEITIGTYSPVHIEFEREIDRDAIDTMHFQLAYCSTLATSGRKDEANNMLCFVLGQLNAFNCLRYLDETNYRKAVDAVYRIANGYDTCEADGHLYAI